MLDTDQIAAASQVLVQHWRDGSKLDALETRLRCADSASRCGQGKVSVRFE